MIFPTKSSFLAVTSLALALFATCPVQGQISDYSDLQNLPGLRTMANTPTDLQSGMDVGNINVSSVVTGNQSNLKEMLPEGTATQGMLPMAQILFDTAKLDPDQYVVGPDDQILIYLFGQLDKEYVRTVSPEGILSIPTVGPVSVANMTLTEAKAAVTREVMKKYKGIALTVTLAHPRYFRVFVSGQVRNPGAVDAHSLMRVSDIINSAGLKPVTRPSDATAADAGSRTRVTDTAATSGSSAPASNSNLVDLKPVSSQRSITVHRGNVDISVDLVRFQRFGDLSVNPYVRAGDRIEVKSYLGSVYLYGQVNEPGRYEIQHGDHIADMIQFSGGLTPVADSLHATLTRFDVDGKEITKTNIDLYDALVRNPNAPQYVMSESDRLSVWAKYQYKRIENVTLRGEVKFPGTYAIISNQTTLSEIIEIAGGFTDNANLEEASLIRQSSTVQDLEYQRLARTPMTDMTEEEKDIFKNMSRTQRGAISVDFVKLFRGSDRTNDILLQNGDNVTIPVLRGFVNVMGAVQQPGFMRVEEGKSVDFYVSKAGGFNWNAHKSKMRVIKARTGQRFRASKSVAVEPGDTIHVPEKKPVDVWGTVKDAALVFANVATIILLARQLTE